METVQIVENVAGVEGAVEEVEAVEGTVKLVQIDIVLQALRKFYIRNSIITSFTHYLLQR